MTTSALCRPSSEGSHRIPYIRPAPSTVAMARDPDGEWLFCNYCGEPVDLWSSAYNHVALKHAAEVHVGPAEFDPGRKKKGLTIEWAGSIIILAVFAALIIVLTPTMTTEIFTVLIVGLFVSVAFVFIYADRYSKKYERPFDGIIADVHAVCDICGERMSFRDWLIHSKTYHPDELKAIRRMDIPMAVVMISLVVLGFGGLFVGMLVYDVEAELDGAALTLFIVSIMAIVLGLASGLLYDRFVFRPRTERMAREWSDVHGNRGRQ